jgi:hypothetical protein
MARINGRSGKIAKKVVVIGGSGLIGKVDPHQQMARPRQKRGSPRRR